MLACLVADGELREMVTITLTSGCLNLGHD
jgi:hypothetical protein